MQAITHTAAVTFLITYFETVIMFRVLTAFIPLTRPVTEQGFRSSVVRISFYSAFACEAILSVTSVHAAFLSVHLSVHHTLMTVKTAKAVEPLSLPDSPINLGVSVAQRQGVGLPDLAVMGSIPGPDVIRHLGQLSLPSLRGR